jgi:hypothetical protein
MKIKIDYITNSSSASFYVLKKYVSEHNRQRIYNHIEEAKKSEFYTSHIEDYDKWHIEEDEDYIKGNTIMNNFDMYHFLVSIGIPEDKIIYGE